MHVLQPKHSLLKPEEAEKLFSELNINKFQLPKITKHDPALPKEAKIGDVVKIERKVGDKKTVFYRVVVP
ncbi:MAG: DNA-directed RNA polymerase subunit RpoH/Rpb5 C-terminal domain-containing protein [Candidatus Pacearchaeota archaeon]